MIPDNSYLLGDKTIVYDKKKIVYNWSLTEGTAICAEPFRNLPFIKKTFGSEDLVLLHPKDYMDFCVSLSRWELALTTLREIIHHKIDTNQYEHKTI